MTEKVPVAAFGMIDSDTLKLHKATIEASLKDFCDKNNLNLVMRKGAFDRESFTINMEFFVVQKDTAGAVIPPEQVTWNLYAEDYHLKKEWLHQECVVEGHRFIVVGLDKGAKAKVVVINKADKSRSRVMHKAVAGYFLLLEESETLGNTAEKGPPSAAAPTIVSHTVEGTGDGW